MDNHFTYTSTELPIRVDLPAAHRRTWEWLAAPDDWWSGDERVSIAQTAREALTCDLCHERKQSLSPNAVQGIHDTSVAHLPDWAVEATHRLVNDHGRLTKNWLENLLAQVGATDAHYVELLGIVAHLMSIDSLHRAIGIELEPLPSPLPGEPRKLRPSGLNTDKAWVPTLDYAKATKAQRKQMFVLGKHTPVVAYAISLVPSNVERLMDLGSVHYWVAGIEQSDWAISRLQAELVAARVSTLNDCFYCASIHATLLEATARNAGIDIDLQSLVQGDRIDSGIPASKELLAFTEAVFREDKVQLPKTRQTLIETLGSKEMVDTGCIIGNFQRMNRIANGTGIAVDGYLQPSSEHLGKKLGMTNFDSYNNTPSPSWLKRCANTITRPFFSRLLKTMINT